ncbi:hypothetical protein GvMRE_I2g234 [endosymbiont GvMRE of Glomus versiforme]|nr:hypothetical protein GvMRE_I2g234 [endosymbiont GvMRE of Glomus versiforme]
MSGWMVIGIITGLTFWLVGFIGWTFFGFLGKIIKGGEHD